MTTRRKIGVWSGLVLGGVLFWNIIIQPSNDREWSTDQTLLPSAEITGDDIIVRNVRHFSYASPLEFVPRWEDRRYRLDELERVWYIVEPFADYPGAAHTFLSFEFKDDQFLALSVEIRKEQGEQFSAWKGLFRSYELMYVAGDERDLVKLRSNFRKDAVYVYPIRTSSDKAQTLLLSMLERMNALSRDPEFYNTLTNTCTTNIVKHVNTITPKRIPIRSEIIFPAESDRLAYELGLIDTELSFEDARRHFHINERALQYADAKDFSRRIREPLPTR